MHLQHKRNGLVGVLREIRNNTIEDDGGGNGLVRSVKKCKCVPPQELPARNYADTNDQTGSTVDIKLDDDKTEAGQEEDMVNGVIQATEEGQWELWMRGRMMER